MSNNNSIYSIATITNKSENQDCFGEFVCEPFKYIFVADGLGSYAYPKLASEKFINSFKSKIETSIINDNTDFSKLLLETFKKAKDDIIIFSKDFQKDKNNSTENLFGTTAIVLIETTNKIIIAYVGNGAIWHIRGAFNSFNLPYLFPWNSINLLNPHSIPQDGKEALYKLISDNNDYNECIPTIIEISKDQEFGDIIMICTDGIFSADQVRFGKNDKGVWVKYEPAILEFYKYLTGFFAESDVFSKEKLDEMLDGYLNELKPTFDDDATIGILISNVALEYQKNKS